MDVRLPDGTIVQNVPEGITQSELMARVGKMNEKPAESSKTDMWSSMGGGAFQNKGGADTAEVLAGNPAVRFAMGAASPVIAAAQLVNKGTRAAVKGLGGSEELANTLSPELVDPVRLEQMKKAGMKSAGTEGYDVMGLAGTALNPFGLAAGKVIAPAAGVAGKMAQGAGVGAAYGGLTPVTEEGDFWKQKGIQTAGGAAIGGAIPAVTGLTKWAGKQARDTADLFLPGGPERIANRYTKTIVGEPGLQKVINAAQQAREIVPGSKPTVAEAIAGVPEGSPIMEHQRIVAETPGGISAKFMERTQAQKGAREADLESIAKGISEKSALGIRSAASNQNYEEAKKQVVKGDAKLSELLGRPSMKKVFGRAKELAEDFGDKFKIGQDIPEHIVEGKILGESGKPIIQETVAAKSAEYPVASLHYMKMALDDMIKNPERFGIGATEARAIGGIREKFVDWLGKKSPAYDFARSEHARLSGPLNRAQVRDALIEKLLPPTGTEATGTYLKALENPLPMLKKATGQTRFEKTADVLQPAEEISAQRVASDLERKLASIKPEQKTNLHGGVNVAEETRTHVPQMLSRTAMIVNAVLRGAGKGVEGKVDSIMAERYLDPQKFAQDMQKMTPTQRQIMIEEIKKRARIPAIGAVVTAAEGNR
jgi:hypothetical protein